MLILIQILIDFSFILDDDREISHYTDSDERPIGKRTVLGYNNNTIPRTRKNVDRPIQGIVCSVNLLFVFSFKRCVCLKRES